VISPIEPTVSSAFSSSNSLLFAALQDVNERCLELLVNAARCDEHAPLFVRPLIDLLHNCGPEIRRRLAERKLLLLDMQFHSFEWWQAVRALPDKRWRTASGTETFPRRAAIPLARATLSLAWHSIRADSETTCVLLGMTRSVAQLIGGLQLSEIDRVAELRFRNLQPRWRDTPHVWRALLLAARTTRDGPMRDATLYALQLLSGELISFLRDSGV
jgi:hypothetical protein